MFKKLNIKGVSHHLLLPILAVLVVAGIGGYIMQRSSSAATGTTAQSKACYDRVFKQGSSSICVKYALQVIKPAGLSPGVAYGPKTAGAVEKFGGSTTLDKKTWGKICTKASPAMKTKIGCPGYRTTKADDAATAKRTACNKRTGWYYSNGKCIVASGYKKYKTCTYKYEKTAYVAAVVKKSPPQLSCSKQKVGKTAVANTQNSRNTYLKSIQNQDVQEWNRYHK